MDFDGDLDIAAELRAEVEASGSAGRRAASVARDFGYARLTNSARNNIVHRLRAAGLETRPSLLTCDHCEPVELHVVAGPITSNALTNQLVTWHEHNWTGSGDSGPYGEWLRCLKSTHTYDRQLIWHASSIAAVVTFAGWLRAGEGYYEGWGSITRLERPISRDRLLADARTRARFDARGIRALQGAPIRIDPRLATAITEMAGEIEPTMMPLDEPDYDEESILWTGLEGLNPEATIEAAVAANRDLWQKLGFPSPPRRQVPVGTAGRADLLAGQVVGEAKRAVTLRDGPAQIERYLTYIQRRTPRQTTLRGLLLQCSPNTTDNVIERLESSPFTLELWAVTRRRRWRLERLA